MGQTILYKLDAGRRVREWCIWQEDRNRVSTVHIRHGLLNGEKQFEKLDYASPGEAKTELDRRIHLMRDRRGYTEHIPVDRPYRPMLAQVYHPEKTRLPEQVMIQPKLNGERCLGAHKWMMSRKATFFRSAPHIQEALSVLPPDIVLDGEIYVHGESVQKIHSWASIDREHDNSHKLEYHVFDIVDEALPFHTRTKQVQMYVQMVTAAYTRGKCPVKFVDTLHLPSSDVDLAYKTFLSEGYEGAMIRFMESFYELNVRSFGLYKYKPKQQKWFKIVDVIPGTGRARLHGIARCITDDGKFFKCSLSMPDYVKIQFLNQKSMYIGKSLLVEFIDYSDDGIPTHLSGKDLR